jgi:hypothetical protein
MLPPGANCRLPEVLLIFPPFVGASFLLELAGQWLAPRCCTRTAQYQKARYTYEQLLPNGGMLLAS